MIQLEDLNNDCLQMVLDLLSPNQLMRMRLNKRLRQLANEKLRAKTRVIRFKGLKYDFSDCYHLDPIKDQKLIFQSEFENEVNKFYHRSPSKQASFMNLFSISCHIKSIDFGMLTFTDGFLLNVVRHFPELECINLRESLIQEDDWKEALEQIGPKLVHFNGSRIKKSDLRLFKLVVEMCPNIKQVDCFTRSLTNGLLSTFKKLPKNCWFKLECSELDDFDDVIDDLDVRILDRAFLGNRVERLSSLKTAAFGDIKAINNEVNKIKFTGLKWLLFNPIEHDEHYVSCLIASRFPSLEVFIFNANGLSQDDYHRLFQGMPALNVLTIYLDLDEDGCQLPQLTSLSQLKNLEKFNLIFEAPFDEDWPANEFLQRIEEYVNEIFTLKTLTVDVSDWKCEWKETVVKEIERMKLKQDRVEIKSVYEGSNRRKYMKKLSR